MDDSFIAKATGIVFRESFEAVLIYGIIVSYFKKSLQEGDSTPVADSSATPLAASPSSSLASLRSAKFGLVLGIVASALLGAALAGAIPSFSPEVFSIIEIFICLGGSLMMLYMVFWMSENSKHLKRNIESSVSSESTKAIAGAVFVAVFREGVEAVVYLYSLAMEKPTLVQRSSVGLSLVLGVALAFIVYRLMIQGSKWLSLRTVFRISGAWLLFSSSSLLATSFDKVFSAGFFERLSQPLYSLELSEPLSYMSSAAESLAGFRAQPSPLHFATFLLFWGFVICKDPLQIRAAGK